MTVEPWLFEEIILILTIKDSNAELNLSVISSSLARSTQGITPSIVLFILLSFSSAGLLTDKKNLPLIKPQEMI